MDESVNDGLIFTDVNQPINKDLVPKKALNSRMSPPWCDTEMLVALKQMRLVSLSGKQLPKKRI